MSWFPVLNIFAESCVRSPVRRNRGRFGCTITSFWATASPSMNPVIMSVVFASPIIRHDVSVSGSVKLRLTEPSSAVVSIGRKKAVSFMFSRMFSSWGVELSYPASIFDTFELSISVATAISSTAISFLTADACFAITLAEDISYNTLPYPLTIGLIIRSKSDSSKWLKAKLWKVKLLNFCCMYRVMKRLARELFQADCGSGSHWLTSSVHWCWRRSSSDLSYIVAISLASAGLPSGRVTVSFHCSFCPGNSRSRNVVHFSLRRLSGVGREIIAVCL